MAKPLVFGGTPTPTTTASNSSSSPPWATLSPPCTKKKKRRRSADDVEEAGQQHRQHRRPPLHTATEQVGRPQQVPRNADRRRSGSGGDATLALVGQTLEMLRSEVRSLRDENQRLRDQMAMMMAHQSSTSRVLATLQQQEHKKQQQRQPKQPPGEREQPKQQQTRPQAAQHLPPMALFRSSASSTMPAVALMEAMHEMPFLRDYPMLTGFAVPDFRFPVIAVEFASVFDHRPPTIIYANAAMCRLSEYSSAQLIGAPVTALIVLQESHRRVLGPYITRQEPGSLGTVFHFNHLIRSKSGRLWRAVADDTQFFFDKHGSAKHTVISVAKWEAGHLGDGEELDHWAPLAESTGPAPPSSSSSSSASEPPSRLLQPAPPSQPLAPSAAAMDHHYPVMYSPATEEMLKTLLDASTPRQSFSSLSYTSTHASTPTSASTASSASSSSSSTSSSLSASTGLPSSFIPLS